VTYASNGHDASSLPTLRDRGVTNTLLNPFFLRVAALAGRQTIAART
jgi:hypothetical protein